MDKLTVDVVVIGNGPAGATTTLMLAKCGLSVALIGLPSSNRNLFGETLPPDIKTILIHIGLWDDSLNDKHLPSTGNRSAWGSKEITENNFIFHPNTYGWHLDRSKFDFMLLEAAKREGAIYLEAQIENIDKYFNNSWILNLKKIKIVQ